MKTRRHHNNTGYRQIKCGKCELQVRRLARLLRLPYRVRSQPPQGTDDHPHPQETRPEQPG